MVNTGSSQPPNAPVWKLNQHATTAVSAPAESAPRTLPLPASAAPRATMTPFVSVNSPLTVSDTAIVLNVPQAPTTGTGKTAFYGSRKLRKK